MRWIYFTLIVILITGCVRSSAEDHGEDTCSIGYFMCSDNSTCVEQRRICDQVLDCSDGSDEWNCDNEHHIRFWNDMFKKRPDEDFEKENNDCDLSDPPAECFCSNKRLLCESRELHDIPDKWPQETQILDLSSNFITTLGTQSFQNLTELNMLLLSNCHINDIEIGSLSELPNLQSLFLTGNDIGNIRISTFEGNIKLKSLDLSYNHIDLILPGTFHGLNELRDLDLRANGLTGLVNAMFQGLNKLETLHLSKNKLTLIKPSAFIELVRLKTLYLTENHISSIEPFAFLGLNFLECLFLAWNELVIIETDALANITNLINLDLSHNNLLQLEIGAFNSVSNLKSLNLRKNMLGKLHQDIFKALNRLQYIYFDEFYMCAIALHVRVCEPKGDGISSLENLLESSFLRTSAWIVAFLACIGNAFVLVGRFLVKEPNEVHSLYIKNLSLSDFLMGVYLFIIASYDAAFRGTYIRHDQQWRLSWQCQFCGFLSTVSCEASVFTLTIITVDRYFSISRPLSVRRRRRRLVALAECACAWGAAVVLAVLPVSNLPYFGDEFYGNNGVCLPLHIHRPFARAWEYSAAMFIGLNFIAFAFILYAYLKMFVIIKDSTVALRSTQEKQDRTIAKRFAFIVGTDFVCWMPIIVIKILTLCGVSIEEDLYAWLAVFILPINSALNPILYTLTTKLFRQQVCRWLYSCKLLKKKQPSQADLSGLSLSSAFFHRSSWAKRSHMVRQDKRRSLSGSNNTASTLRSSIKSCSSRESMKCRINNSTQLCTNV